MKKEQTPTLDDVLDAYAAVGPSRSALREWTRRYPHFRKDLVDFTVHWAVLHHLPSTEDGPDLETLTLRGMSVVEDLLHSTRQQGATGDQERESEGAPPNTNVVSGRQPSGTLEHILTECELDLETFGRHSGLGFSLLVNLEMGRITFKNESDKERVLVALAESISKAAPARRQPGVLLPLLSNVLERPPRRSPGANLARGKPRAVTQDFFEAIRTDPDMSDEEKERWLELESRN